jgi:hypothetical protein
MNSINNHSFEQFVQTMETADSIECVERMAYMSQMRRRGSTTSICSEHSINSNASVKSIVPAAVDYDSALHQKGFELRQFDSNEDFDLILGAGFDEFGMRSMPTLKLTLTPKVLRE